MNDTPGYAVYLFPQALEALGDAIKPYLQQGPGGLHVLCREVDTGGALIEMTLDGLGFDGKPVQLELMIPSNMVRMIVSARSDGAFGFGPRIAAMAMAMTSLPPVGPTAAPADAPSAVVPAAADADAAEPVEAPPKP